MEPADNGLAAITNQAVAQSNIFEELGLTDLPEAEQKALLENFLDAIQAAITSRLIAELTEEQVKELDKVLEAGDNAAVNQFLAQNVPTMDAIAQEEITRFKDELKAKVTIVRQYLDKAQEPANAA